MTITVDTAAFHRAAALAAQVVTGRPLIAPDVLLSADYHTVTLTGSDHEVTLRLPAPAAGAEPGRIAAVNGPLLAAISREAETGTLTLQPSGETLLVTAGRARWRLPVQAPETVVVPPRPDEAPAITVQASHLRDALDAVAYAVSPDPRVPFMAGARLQARGDTLVATGTDGYRLARATVAMAGQITLPAVTVPRKALGLLSRLLANQTAVQLRISQTTLAADIEQASLWCQLVEATWPDLDAVLPDATRPAATIERAPLAAALDRMLPLAEPPSWAVQLSLGDERLTLTVTSSAGSATESLPAKWTGPAAAVSVNLRFLAQALDHLGDPIIRLLFNGPRSPLTCLDDRCRADIMPIASAPKAP